MSDVTQILERVQHGDPTAATELLPLVYEELRRLAAHRMASEAPGQTLQPTALVHEAWLRLAGPAQPTHWDGRGHFFAAAAEAMRRILIDNARRKQTPKHGGRLQRMELSDVELAATTDDERLLAVDESLQRFAEIEPEAARLVRLRFFAGLSNQKAAEVMGLAPRTADRLWSYARAWLAEDIHRETL